MTESLKKGDSRSLQIIFGELLVLGLLAGCSADATASKIPLPPATQPRPEEIDPAFDLPEISPPPSETAPTTVFDAAAENPPATAAIDTPAPTLIPTLEAPVFCGIQPESMIGSQSSTVPLITMEKSRAFLGDNVDDVRAAVVEAGRQLRADGIDKVVIPQLAEDWQTRLTNEGLQVEVYTQENAPVPPGYMAIKLAGFQEGGYAVFLQGDDGLFRVLLPHGALSWGEWTAIPGQEANLDAFTISGQKMFPGLDLKIAKVNGCQPVIALVDGEGVIRKVLNPGVKPGDKPDNLWLGSAEMPPAETATATATVSPTAEATAGMAGFIPSGGSARYEAGERVESREEASLFSENDIAGIANEVMDLLARFAGSEPVKIGLPKFLEGKIYRSKIEDAERMGIEVFFKEDLRGEIYSKNGAWNIEIAAFDGGESAIMIRNPEGKLMRATKEGELIEIPFQKFFENEKILAVNVDGNIRYALVDKNGKKIFAFINESWDAENPQTAFEWIDEGFRANLDRNLNFSFSGVMEKSMALTMVTATGYPLNFPDIKETPGWGGIRVLTSGQVASYQLESKNGNSELKVGVIVEGKFLVVKPDQIDYPEVIDGVITAVLFYMNGLDFEGAKTVASILDYVLYTAEPNYTRNNVQFLLNPNRELTEAEMVDFVRSLLIPVPDDLSRLEVGYDEEYVKSNFEIWLGTPRPNN